MKKIIILSVLVLIAASTKAQTTVNVNFGTPPVWAPADRVAVQYYYLPEIDVYYDVPQQQYIYLSKRNWVRAKELPARCRNYNLRAARVVYLTDYRGNAPYVFHKKHKMKHFRPVRRDRVIYVNNDDNHHKKSEHKGKNKKKHNRD